jgi:hypothetical protein
MVMPNYKKSSGTGNIYPEGVMQEKHNKTKGKHFCGMWNGIDCVYSLKYESGAENHLAAEQKFLSKHILLLKFCRRIEDFCDLSHRLR